jgi:hypothetical protein
MQQNELYEFEIDPKGKGVATCVFQVLAMGGNADAARGLHPIGN